MALAVLFLALPQCVAEEPLAPPPQAQIQPAPQAAPVPAAPPAPVTASPLVEPKPTEDKAAKGENVLAEPISPATVARFPHLRPFQGHVLLSGPSVQVILAGIPPEPSTEDWQPGVVAFAERRFGTWRIMEAMGRVELSGRAASGPIYRPIGVNVGADRAKSLAFATYVFAGTSAEAQRQVVTFRLDGAGGRLSLLPEAFGPAAASVPKGAKLVPVLWRLRFRAVGALNLPARDDQIGGFRGVPYLMRYQGAEMLSVIGFRPFDVDEQLGQLTLSPELGLDGPLVEGWQLLIGRDAALGTLSAAGTIKACMYTKDRAAAKLVAGCNADGAFGALALALPARDAGRKDVAQPVFVYDAAGNPVFYTAVFAGESVRAELPRAANYRLADTRSGRSLKDLAAFAVTGPEGFKAELAARGAGRILVDPGEDRSPAMVTINRLDQPKGLPIAPGLAEPSRHVTQLSANSFLVREWPVELPLLSGSYVVELARGGDGVFCNVRALIVENQVRQHLCPTTTFKTEIPADKDFIAADLTASVVQTGGELGETLKKVYGVTFLQLALTVEDEETGLELRFVPGSKALAERWAASRGKARGGVLLRFSKFIRVQPEAAAGVLELGCPAPGITLGEYERTANRLYVDAVRLFGCATGSEQNEHLAAAGRMVRRKKAPLAITSVAALAHAVSGAFFPRLFVPARELGPTPDLAGFLARVKAGDAVATAGAVVRVAELKGRGALRGEFEATIEVSASPEVRARYIFLYTEQGQVKREPIPDGDQPVRTVKVTFKAPPDAQWIRVEARGSSRRSSVSQLFDRNYGIALATTGFMPLKVGVSH